MSDCNRSDFNGWCYDHQTMDCDRKAWEKVQNSQREELTALLGRHPVPKQPLSVWDTPEVKKNLERLEQQLTARRSNHASGPAADIDTAPRRNGKFLGQRPQKLVVDEVGDFEERVNRGEFTLREQTLDIEKLPDHLHW